MVKRWKLRGRVLEARRQITAWHMSARPQGEMAQHAHEVLGEDLFHELVEAEYQFLGGGTCEVSEELTWRQAEVRACDFSLRSMMLVERLTREPEHPILSTEKDPEDEPGPA